MSQKIVIDPVTRLEGHAKITLQTDDRGEVQAAYFHVTQLRGFEKFCEGRPYYEMPNIMARICGICPVSHLIASAKAGDAILAVRIPSVAAKLRRIMNLAQLVQSHALSFFYLSSPDLLLGMDSDPAQRNLLGVAQKEPNLARRGINLRKFGQEIIEHLGGKRIHPGWVVPGGVNEPLSSEKRDSMLAAIPRSIEDVQYAIAWFKSVMDKFREEMQTFANFPTLFMGLVAGDRNEYYDGKLRITDEEGNIVADGLDGARYQEFLDEAVEPFTYMKFPYFKPIGYANGIYRVGPLARLNLASSFGTPLADTEKREFWDREHGRALSSFLYHYARLIEMLHGIEAIHSILEDPEILSQHVRSAAALNNSEGVGVAEAPRGTLIHHYKVDDNGLITWANLVIATGHNNAAMNRGILQAAKHYVHGNQIEEGILIRVEAVIRCFDPCLSCSTHAVGQMPLIVRMLGPDGSLLGEVRRN